MENDYEYKYKKYKNKYLDLKGGVRLAQGLEGIVFRPPLISSIRNPIYETDDYVGKIMDSEEAVKEFYNSQLVKELDPNGEWSLPIEMISLINPSISSNPEYNNFKVQLISKFGGVSLQKMVNFDDDNLTLINYTKIPLLYRIVKEQIIPIIDKLNEKYLHFDLHLDNILYDENTGKIKFFDFSKLKSKEGLKDYEDYATIFFSLDSITRAIKSRYPVLAAYKKSIGNPAIDPSKEKYITALQSLPDL